MEFHTLTKLNQNRTGNVIELHSFCQSSLSLREVQLSLPCNSDLLTNTQDPN